MLFIILIIVYLFASVTVLILEKGLKNFQLEQKSTKLFRNGTILFILATSVPVS